MGEAARGPFPTLNLRRVAGSRFGREIGRLVGPRGPGQSRTADWVLVLAVGVENRRGLGPWLLGRTRRRTRVGQCPLVCAA